MAIDGLPQGTRYLVAFPVEVHPESDRDALADVLRGDPWEPLVGHRDSEHQRAVLAPLRAHAEVDEILPVERRQ